MPLSIKCQASQPIIDHEECKKAFPVIFQTEERPIDLSIFADSWKNNLQVRNPKFFNTFTVINNEIAWKDYWQHLGNTGEAILLPLVDVKWNEHLLLAIVGPPAPKEVFAIPGISSAFLSWPDENLQLVSAGLYSSFETTLLKIEIEVVKKLWVDRSTFAPHIKYEYAPILILRIPWRYSAFIAVEQIESSGTQSTGPRIKSSGL